MSHGHLVVGLGIPESLPLVTATSVFFFFFNFYLFLTALGIHCCTQAFPSCSKRGLPSSLGVQASHCGGPLVELRLSCLTACGFFPEQGSNPCPLPYQADS